MNKIEPSKRPEPPKNNKRAERHFQPARRKDKPEEPFLYELIRVHYKGAKNE